jgi:transcriptional regulator with GAF, ATPase, and Fis domain
VPPAAPIAAQPALATTSATYALAPATPLNGALALSHAFLTLDQAMARHIQDALEKTNGRIEGKGGAADLLEINPHTLRSRMKKLGVDWNRFRASQARA